MEFFYDDPQNLADAKGRVLHVAAIDYGPGLMWSRGSLGRGCLLRR